MFVTKLFPCYGIHGLKLLNHHLLHVFKTYMLIKSIKFVYIFYFLFSVFKI